MKFKLGCAYSAAGGRQAVAPKNGQGSGVEKGEAKEVAGAEARSEAGGGRQENGHKDGRVQPRPGWHSEAGRGQKKRRDDRRYNSRRTRVVQSIARGRRQ